MVAQSAVRAAAAAASDVACASTSTMRMSGGWHRKRGMGEEGVPCLPEPSFHPIIQRTCAASSARYSACAELDELERDDVGGATTRGTACEQRRMMGGEGNHGGMEPTGRSRCSQATLIASPASPPLPSSDPPARPWPARRRMGQAAPQRRASTKVERRTRRPPRPRAHLQRPPVAATRRQRPLRWSRGGAGQGPGRRRHCLQRPREQRQRRWRRPLTRASQLWRGLLCPRLSGASQRSAALQSHTQRRRRQPRRG